jgi:predicted DNA-binding protein YlxM (UPF0122 family)
MKSVEDLMLLDFYGNLLTDKMRDCLELYLNDDLTLAEIADDAGISRQGAHDTVKRAIAQLHSYEEKLGLVARFSEQKKIVEEAISYIEVKDYDNASRVLEELKNDLED